jgi:ATP-dependent Clp protease ATP-binding subunit ClpA
MFERFTSPARQAVAAAQAAARRLHHRYLGTEHLLLGLLAEPGSLAGRALATVGVAAEAVEREVLAIVGAGPLADDDAAALAAIGIDLDEVRRRVEASFGPGALQGAGRCGPSPHVPFTPRSKKVLELSLREAVRLRHDHIGTEHILLGLVREGEGLAAQILVRLGASLESVRTAVLDELRRAG